MNISLETLRRELNEKGYKLSTLKGFYTQANKYHKAEYHNPSNVYPHVVKAIEQGAISLVFECIEWRDKEAKIEHIAHSCDMQKTYQIHTSARVGTTTIDKKPYGYEVFVIEKNGNYYCEFADDVPFIEAKRICDLLNCIS